MCSRDHLLEFVGRVTKDWLKEGLATTDLICKKLLDQVLLKRWLLRSVGSLGCEVLWWNKSWCGCKKWHFQVYMNQVYFSIKIWIFFLMKKKNPTEKNPRWSPEVPSNPYNSYIRNSNMIHFFSIIHYITIMLQIEYTVLCIVMRQN